MSLMLQEIEQQPQALARMIDGCGRQVRELERRFAVERPESIVLAARGTSDNAATFARYLLEILLGIPTSLAAPSISTVYDRTPRRKRTLVVGISQSGESTDTNLYLEKAGAEGAVTLGITNESESSLAKLADEVLNVRVGPEKSVAATKTYTGQLLAIYLLAQALGARIPQAALKKLPETAARQLESKERVDALAERYRYMEHAVVAGRGLNYANALELALKLMETSYVVAERFSGADFMHGPLALVEKGFPVFVFALGGPARKGTEKLLARLAEAGAETIVIGPPTAARGAAATKRIFLNGEIPVVDGFPEDLLTPIPAIVPGQLFAACLSEHKGLDPDHPRMLSKVTRTI